MKKKYLLILLIPLILFLNEAFTRPMGGGAPISGGGGGGGSVTAAGNCTGGPCLDGSPDGGTWLGLYDGNSNWWRIDPGDMVADFTWDPMDFSGTGSWARVQSPTFLVNLTTPQFTLIGSDASPDAAGEVRYDSTIAGMLGGGLVWFDNDSVRLIVDLETDPSNDDYVVAYDAAADGFYMKVDDDTGGNTDYENIGDPGGNGSIDMGGFTGTYTDATEAWGGIIFENTDADNAGDTTVVTIKMNDDYDANSIFLSIINDADGGADDHFRVTGLGTYFGAGAPVETMDGQSVFFSSFIEVTGAIHAKGGIVSASANPKATLDDTGGADGYWSVQAADADDAVAEFGVDDSGGDDQSYIELDGVLERIEMKEDVIIEVTIDGGGATSFEVENNNNPTTAAAGDVAVDANHNMLEIFGDASYSIPTMFPIYISVAEPDGMDARDFMPIFTNNTGASITIVSMYAISDDDDTDFRIEEYDADGAANEALVKAEVCDQGGGPYTNDAQTTITNRVIETGHMLVLDFDDTDTPDYLHFTIWYTVGGVN